MQIDKEKLLDEANNARKNSYTPYSHYTVGAALLCSDGEIITGCNIENSSYGATICAERTAIFKAVSNGKKDFLAIAVAGSEEGCELNQFAYPCGICRQVMREFVNPKTFMVYIAGPNGEFIEKTLDDLLPYSFGPENLL